MKSLLIILLLSVGLHAYTQDLILKEWLSIYHYATDLEDTNGNGISDIPEKYRKAKNPIIIQQD